MQQTKSAKKSQQQTRGADKERIIGPAQGFADQLGMMFRVRYTFLFGLVILLQICCSCGKRSEKDHALVLQTKVENLIEKILGMIQEYYQQIRSELKCIPDEIPDTIIGTLKSAIDCVDRNEREYDSGRITANIHKKSFLKCFSDAKTEVEETISSIDPSVDYCPENMTEKTYQINVTTTFTKTFHINIKNGLEITKKKVNLGSAEQMCVFNHGEEDAEKANQTGNEHDSAEHHGKGPSSKKHKGTGHESKEHHGKGSASKKHPDYANAPNEEDDDEFWNGKQSHNESDYDGEGSNEESDYGGDSDYEELYNKGHKPKEHSGKSPAPAQQPGHAKVTQIDGNGEEDGDVGDRESHLLILSNPNIHNSSADHAEPFKKVKDKSTHSDPGPIINDDVDYGNDDWGIDEEKFFFPDTTPRIRFTTHPAHDLEPEKTVDEDYDTGPDAEPEDYNYSNEHSAQDKEKNFTGGFEQALAHVEQRLGQALPATGKQRIQIKPRNQVKQKPKKQQQQNARRHNIKLPKALPRNLQPRQPPVNQAPSALSQSFLQTDF